MDNLLREKTRSKYNKTINTAKDCDLLSNEIHLATNRTVSSTQCDSIDLGVKIRFL